MSGKKEMTFVSYYVPEDGDDAQSPNVFAIPFSKVNLRLSHIYEYFPLKGTYVFRFKFAYNGFVVWLDLANLQAKLPLFKDKIQVKASRVSWEDSKISVGGRVDQKITVASKQNKPQPGNLFDVDYSAPIAATNKQDKKELQHNGNHLDFLNQKQITKANTPHINLLGATNSNGGGSMDFFGGMTGSTPPISTSKKSIEVHLMNSFEKHGDLI